MNRELGHNVLAGSIPLSITTLTSLKNLEMENNMLFGPIPSQIGNLQSLLTL
jgi:Leucine-rich repeat (LRR) protein